MLTRPSFKKSLIVEQFQGNYLKRGTFVVVVVVVVAVVVSVVERFAFKQVYDLCKLLHRHGHRHHHNNSVETCKLLLLVQSTIMLRVLLSNPSIFTNTQNMKKKKVRISLYFPSEDKG